MKDSGLAWLGQVPAHWQLCRAKVFLEEIDERSGTGDGELLSVSHKTGVTPRREKNVTMFLAESNAEHKLCQPGDVVVNTMWAWMAALGVSRHAGLVSPSYGVYRPRRRDQFVPLYLDELLRVPAYRSEYIVRSTGITDSRLRLYPDAFLRIPLLCPPADEQAGIVRFLNHADRCIRRYIAAKQKLIKLLDEQRQAIIYEAATHGLNPTVRLKSSGAEWLGEVPDHWEISALRRFAHSYCDGPFGSGLKSSHYTDGGVRVVRLQNIGYGQFKDRNPSYISEQHYSTLGDHSVRSGDLLVAGLGDERNPAGRACVAPEGVSPAMVKADCFRFRMDLSRIDPDFLAYQLSATARTASILLSRGATRERVNLLSMGARKIALPPLQEQRSIVAHINAATRGLQNAVRVALEEIACLREYRTRLFADILTGILDVRTAAASLPEPVDAQAQALGHELLADDDDVDDDTPPDDDA